MTDNSSFPHISLSLNVSKCLLVDPWSYDKAIRLWNKWNLCWNVAYFNANYGGWCSQKAWKFWSSSQDKKVWKHFWGTGWKAHLTLKSQNRITAVTVQATGVAGYRVSHSSLPWLRQTKRFLTNEMCLCLIKQSGPTCLASWTLIIVAASIAFV